jgi:hypothetical protein
VPRPYQIYLTAATLGLLVAATSVTPARSDEINAITTGEQGDLTMCPGWIYRSHLYHHIELPSEIAVGDTVGVRFGSNPKRYRFPVARIERDGENCVVFSQLRETNGVEKIEIASCHSAT